MRYENPIVPGFYPDPSICKKGQDYYLVSSTFHYFPGVPVFHSTDLLNWKQVGHCLTNKSQLKLDKAHTSGGIYAPTIRYHDGLFYMVTTNLSDRGNFFVTTDDPAKEWSEPVWVAQDGIDPSLLFDNGKVYFCSAAGGGKDNSHILLSEIDEESGQLLTEPVIIWRGTGGRFPEAPHIYKIFDYYYLMIAEGGTEYGHMETIARSKSPYGPYEVYDKNPILTNKNLEANPINGTGHADLIEDEQGNWWMVFLAFRNYYGQYHHLGRETFLAPVEWNDDLWPVVNQNGTVTLTMETERCLPEQIKFNQLKDDFVDEELDFYWNYIRNPYIENYSLTERVGFMRLYGTEITLFDQDSPTFIGRRQQHFECKVSTLIEFDPNNANEEAGLTVLMDKHHHYEIGITHDGVHKKVFVRRTIGSLSAIVYEETIEFNKLFLEINANKRNYDFAFSLDGITKKVVASGETRYLSSEVAGGFTGVYFGIYATGNGRKNSVPADFDYFQYQVNND